MALNAKIKNQLRETTGDSDWNFVATNPINIEVRTPFVINIEKPTESFDDLCMLAQEQVSATAEYDIRNGIVTFKDVATSILPNAFSHLSENEKSIISRFPNSDVSIALLQKVNRFI